MKRKVLIEKKENHVWTFFLEEDQIAEIHCAKSDEQEKVHQIGDIYVAKVQNIVQNIGAAFLEIEPGVNCYFDLRDAQNAFFTHKIGKKPLCIGDELVVQISREAVKTKVPTVTGNISLTGRYAVLTHGNTRIGVSSKISKKDREAYKERLQEYQNDQYGLIIRTNAKDAAFEDVLTEIEQLAVIMLDVDEFRQINELYDRDFGDWVKICCFQSVFLMPEICSTVLYYRSEKCLYGWHGRNSCE